MHCSCCCSAKSGGAVSLLALIGIAILCVDNAHSIGQAFDWFVIYSGILVGIVLTLMVTLLIRSLRKDAIPAVSYREPVRVISAVPYRDELEKSTKAVLGASGRTAIAAPAPWYSKPVDVGDALRIKQ